MYDITPPETFPPMWTRPSAAAILACLDRLGAEEAARRDASLMAKAGGDVDLDMEAASSGVALQHAQRATRAVARYLGSIVESELLWLADDDEREAVWAAASRRLAERCGRSAMGEMTRSWPLVVEPPRESPQEPPQQYDLVLHEPALVGDALGFKTWGTAYVMARLLPAWGRHQLRHLVGPEQTEALRILELGAGTGLLGLAAAVSWPGSDVILTDLADIVPNLAANVARNADLVASRGSQVRAAVLQWGGRRDAEHPEEADTEWFVHQPRRFPLVLAADPLYDDEHAELLASAVDEQLERETSARAVVMVPLRDRHTEAMAGAFVAAMAARQFAVTDEGRAAGRDSDWGGKRRDSMSGDGDGDAGGNMSDFSCSWWVFRRSDETRTRS